MGTEVAFSFAVGENHVRPKYRKTDKELSKDEFDLFFNKYAVSDDHRHEFFLRTLFSTFDKDGDGVWFRKELADFVDSVFYDTSNSINNVFVGGRRLPPKKELVSAVQKRLDTNNDRCLTYDEVRDLLEVAAHIADVK